MAEFAPIPDPSGAMDPPRRNPPTAVGAPAFDPAPSPFDRPWARRRPSLIRQLAVAALEVADEVAGALKRTLRRLA